MGSGTRELLIDLALGLVVAALVAATVVLAASSAPTFIYRAF